MDPGFRRTTRQLCFQRSPHGPSTDPRILQQADRIVHVEGGTIAVRSPREGSDLTRTNGASVARFLASRRPPTGNAVALPGTWLAQLPDLPRVLITGGAGYLGSVVAHILLRAGHHVCVFDSLLHGGRSLASLIGDGNFEWLRGDIRNPRDVAAALQGADAVVHLAAIVGDPACARDPQIATAVNRDASLSLLDAARRAGVRRFVFASTCSNYGRTPDSSRPVTEDADLRPVSHYAETKVAVEHAALQLSQSPMAVTVLRFATLFGISPRMRFDLTVNEFVMEMLIHRKLEVYGEHFWRPYVHVRDAAAAIERVLAASSDEVAQQVFNVGRTDENYRKLDLVALISDCVGGADVNFVSVAEDPRDYRVCFDRLATRLGFVPTRRVADGVAEIAAALRAGVFGDLTDPAYANLHRSRRATTGGPGRGVACAP